jgi:tetratricopeptide (TPR) repeat protein
MYVHYNAALIHMQLGDSDKALSSLERAVDLEYQPALLSLDPAFVELRDEERFKRLGSKN